MKTAKNKILQEENAISCPDLLENMNDGVAVYNAIDDGQDFVFCEHNSAGERITGIPREQVIGRRVTEIFPGIETFGLLEVFRRVFKTGEREEHTTSQYQDERVILWVENSVFKLPGGEIVAVYRDISKQTIQQERIAHLSLLRNTGLTIHRHMATIQDKQQLLQAICDVFVNDKGYRSAWIVLLDDKKRLTLSANAGLLKDFCLLEQQFKQGNLSPCITKILIDNQLLWQESQQSLCEECPMANGYPDTGLMTSPLLYMGKLYGVLNVCLSAKVVTDNDERDLFKEMARDIAFALFNREQDRRRMEHEQEIAIRDQISRTFIIHQDNNLYGEVLNIILSAMKSRFGVFGYLDGPDLLVCPSMTTSVWDQCQIPDKIISFPREKWAGIWRNALTSGSTQYSNSPFTVPEGHLNIDNSMAAAIIYDGKVIGLLQVANKEEGYDEQDKKLLESMAGTIAPILQARLEQQRAEKKLQTALDEYADLYNNAPDMFVSVEVESKIIIKCNQTVLDKLGYTRNELIGRSVLDLYYPGDLDEIKNNIYPTFLKTGKVQNRVLRLLHKDGSIIPVSVETTAVRDKDGKILHSRTIWHDITQQKKLEEQILISEKMTTIAGLAAGVAHEINTPLSGILQSIQLIEMGLDPTHEQNLPLASNSGVDLVKVQDYLHKKDLPFFFNGIRDAATKAAHIVTDLLQFSRPQENTRSRVRIAELIDRSIELARADYNMKKEYNVFNIEFIKQHSNQDFEIKCMAMEIEQVLINLIKNSCQAMAENKSLATPQILIRTRQFETTAIIEVEDNGFGIDEETYHHIFNPFFTTKEVGEGTGLGLSVAYSIIKDKHGGTIRAESTPGEGTTFIIELPMERTGKTNE